VRSYRGPGHEIIIVEMPGGSQLSQDCQTMTQTKSSVATTGSVESVDFDGKPAAWLNGHTLLWEADSISFEVGGLDLDLAEALKIARSLH
jgi:hypothetical protein